MMSSCDYLSKIAQNIDAKRTCPNANGPKSMLALEVADVFCVNNE